MTVSQSKPATIIILTFLWLICKMTTRFDTAPYNFGQLYPYGAKLLKGNSHADLRHGLCHEQLYVYTDDFNTISA
jgi:hypothetical protein